MPYLFVTSLEYGDLFQKLLSRRLMKAGEEFIPEGGALLVKKDQAAAGAISDCILYDLRPPELARLIGLLPVSLRMRNAILPRAMELASRKDHGAYAKKAVTEFMRGENRLIAEGFLRFRLPAVCEDWALAVDRAGEELAIGNEYAELLRLLAEAAGPEEPKCGGDVVLILHADGSASVTDERGRRVESCAADEESLLPLIAGFAPDSVSVYDLTGGAKRGLLASIREVFGGKACFFILRK